MDNNWKKLVAKYKPENARICNCGCAYQYQCGHGLVEDNGEMVAVDDLWACPDGCSAAQITARDYVARRVLDSA